MSGLKKAFLSGIFAGMENTSNDSARRVESIERYLAAYNAFDVAGMLALLAPGVRFENYSGGQLTAQASGIDEFRRLAEQSKAVFSEREQRITAIEHGEGSVITGIAYRGKLAVDVPDGPRAGTVLDLQGQSEFWFDGALITKIVDRS
ncbi:MAG: nuclear transport factor 2 family protein [Pseudomonadota bacterium]